MKRPGELRRTTPLTRGQPLRARESAPGRPASGGRRRTNAFPTKVRALVAARSGGWCEAWLGELPCTGRATEMHHRRLRGRRGLLPGTNEASNAAYLCTPCHRWAHHEVAFARDVYGLIVASMADPRRVPIWSRHHRSPVLLLDDGSWQHASAD